MLIDLRSDTLTKPTPQMLEAMMSATVGDDVFGEDPTVNDLENKAANMLGFEAGIFCPSGTMANQIAIRVLTNPQDEVICDRRAHIYLYEGGGIASNSMVSVTLLDGDRGRISSEQIVASIKPDDIHFPRTRLVALENTVNKGGGCYYTLDEMAEIHTVCSNHGLSVHLDGARLFNAVVASGDDPKQIGKYFDSASVCMSKGLGAPVGSLLLSSKANIKTAKRVRKVFGGAMRQAGYIAAAGIYALNHHIDRLADDHRRAQEIAGILMANDQIVKVEPVDTNIIIFTLQQDASVEKFLLKLENSGILALPFGGQSIRMVTHLDIDDAMTEAFEKVFRNI